MSQSDTGGLHIQTVLQGMVLVPGTAQGEIMATTVPMSFWGGYDPETGEIIDRRHPLSGQTAKGVILALPFIRGSSTSTAILLEAIRRGTAPAALVTTGTDPYMVLAAVVGEELFELTMPVISVSTVEYHRVSQAKSARIDLNGLITLSGSAS